MGGHKLASYRWEWTDPYDPEKWTAFTVSVWELSFEHPYVSVLVSIANGGGKCLFRCASLREARSLILVPIEGLPKLKQAIKAAGKSLAALRGK